MPRTSGSVTEGLRQMEQFFQGKDQVHKTLRRLVKNLEKARIAYVVLGGLALNAHRYRRVTTDVDVLLTPDGFAEFKRRFVGKVYEPVEKRPRRFTDRKNGVRLDVLLTGLYPGSGRPGPIAFPDPGRVSERIEEIAYVDLVTLVQLKLAARRWRDFADVVELIRHNDLGDDFAEKLHSAVRADYVECLEEKRREDEYEAREE
jgi:hypothetical protein